MLKSQSSLEYLLTYGWVVVVIVIIALAIYRLGGFNPDQNTAMDVKALSYFFVSDALINTDGSLYLILGQRTGKTIVIEDINYSLIGIDCYNSIDEPDFVETPETLKKVMLFPRSACFLEPGDMVRLNISVAYRTLSGLEHKDIGMLRLEVQPQAPLVEAEFEKIGPSQASRSEEIEYKITYNIIGAVDYIREWDDYREITTSGKDETSSQLVLGDDGYVYMVVQRWVGSGSSPSTYYGNYWEIYILRSLDNTQSWEDVKRITNNNRPDIQPNIMSDNDGKLIVVFEEYDGNDDELFISTSDNGVDWSTPYQITDDNYNEGDATIEQDSSGTYYITYEAKMPSDPSTEIYIINSTDLIHWSQPFRITSNSYPDYDPDILVYNDTFFLTWAPAVSPTQEIYYSKSDNPYDLSQWNANKRQLTNNSVHDFEPSLFIDKEGRIFISYIRWMNQTGDTDRSTTEIYILESKLSNDSGWTNYRLTNNDVRDTYPGIIQDSNGFHHVFYSHYNGSVLGIVAQDTALNPYDAMRLHISDFVPNGTTLVPGTISHNGQYDSGTIYWDLYDLYAGNEGWVSFNVTIDSTVLVGTTITNTAQISFYNWENRLVGNINKSVQTLIIS